MCCREQGEHGGLPRPQSSAEPGVTRHPHQVSLGRRSRRQHRGRAPQEATVLPGVPSWALPMRMPSQGPPWDSRNCWSTRTSRTAAGLGRRCLAGGLGQGSSPRGQQRLPGPGGHYSSGPRGIGGPWARVSLRWWHIPPQPCWEGPGPLGPTPGNRRAPGEGAHSPLGPAHWTRPSTPTDASLGILGCQGLGLHWSL